MQASAASACQPAKENMLPELGSDSEGCREGQCLGRWEGFCPSAAGEAFPSQPPAALPSL